jgi:hypothetical protein
LSIFFVGINVDRGFRLLLLYLRLSLLSRCLATIFLLERREIMTGKGRGVAHLLPDRIVAVPDPPAIASGEAVVPVATGDGRH